jgi:hypothetical protein
MVDDEIPLREIWGPAWFRIRNARDDFRWCAKHLPPLEGDVPEERRQAYREFIARVKALADEANTWQAYMYDVQGGWEGPK